MQRFVGILAFLIVLPGCNRSTEQPGEPKELETVDIGGGIDAELTTEFDERAKQVGIEMGGVLPSDFPPQMPVFSPSSVVDFGPGFVELDTPSSAAAVRSSLGRQIQQAGWTVDSVGDGGSLYSHEGYRVRVIVSDAGSGSRVRYEY